MQYNYPSTDPYLFREADYIIPDTVGNNVFAEPTIIRIKDIIDRVNFKYTQVPTYNSRNKLYRCVHPIAQAIRIYCDNGGYSDLSIYEFLQRMFGGRT